MLLVYKILNSIIYFSLVCQDSNRIYTTRYVILTNLTILARVRYLCMRYILRGKYSDMARTWIGFQPTSKSKTCVFVELFTLIYIMLLLWVLTTRGFYTREAKKDNIPVLYYQGS